MEYQQKYPGADSGFWLPDIGITGSTGAEMEYSHPRASHFRTMGVGIEC